MRYKVGRAAHFGLTPNNYRQHGVSRAQLEKGIAVEYEHTDDHDIARQIALDHLSENPHYYDMLIAMEESANRAGGRKIVRVLRGL